MTDIHAVGSHYPCCGRTARFAPAEQSPGLTIHRVCAHCKRGWYVTRTVVAPGDPRLDDLTWRTEEEVTLEEREKVYRALKHLEEQEAELPPGQFESIYGPDHDRAHGFRAVDVASAMPTFTRESWRQLYAHLEVLTQEERIHRAEVRYKSQRVARYRTVGG